MELDLGERLVLVNTLPEKGDFKTIKTIESLKDKLYPSEEESKEFEIQQVGKGLGWNEKGREKLDIEITEGETEIIIENLELLDKKKEATIAHYKLHERFTKNE